MRIQAIFDDIAILTGCNVLIVDGFLLVIVDFLLKLAENESIVMPIRLYFGRNSSIVHGNQLNIHDLTLNLDNNRQIIDNNQLIIDDYKRYGPDD